jgi:hypothetical protein
MRPVSLAHGFPTSRRTETTEEGGIGTENEYFFFGRVVNGGHRPRWSRDSRELFYRQGDALMAVSVGTGASFRAFKPQRLFAGSYRGESQEAAFDVSPDSRRFLMIKSDDDG